MRQSSWSWIVMRPVCFFLLLVLVVLSLAALLITTWCNKVARMEKDSNFISNNLNQEFILGIQNASALFSPDKASATRLARILSHSLDDDDDLQFPVIETKVVPALFLAYATIPYLTQISYIGLNGLFFAYYEEQDESPNALYSNLTFAKNYTWYKQPASRDTGELYGEAIRFPAPDVVNTSLFRDALNSTDGYASVGTGWKNSQDVLLHISVGLNGNDVVSLGFSMKPLLDFLANEMAFYDGSLYLVATDWNVVIHGLPNTRAISDGDQVLFQVLKDEGGNLRTVGNISCQSSRDEVVRFGGKKYMIKCSPAEIAGLQFVYVFAIPRDEQSSLVHKNITVSFVLLIIMVGATVAIVCIFVYLIVEAARREMCLCGALIKQMESTQQSERKSMNKSLALASASHDIRAPLAGIKGLIEICCNELNKKNFAVSEVIANLLQMEACTMDLLGILNGILDMSKIEAGKMQLEEEAFNLEKLLEDVVDFHHPSGMKKGVDVILDPCDGSVSSLPIVRGDQNKLKQILINLLSNAVKFTSEGHVAVRAWARKPSLKNEVFSSSQSNSMSSLLCLLFNLHRTNSETEGANGVQRDPNCIEITFEVNDTGKGIPKEKRNTVFENYVQVKETAVGQEGTGLGLGIVQSLVRLMGGEIRIVEKDVGERGTCFRFRVLLNIVANGDYVLSSSLLHSGLFNRVRSTERSLVVLMVQSDKRSKLLEAFMQRLGIKVYVARQHQRIGPTLKQITRKTNARNFSSRSGGSSMRSVPLSSLDGVDEARPGFVLMVIDTRTGSFVEMNKEVFEFRRDLDDNWYSRVIWLDVSDSSRNNVDEDKLAPPDLVISKPFHGSRLYQSIALLPEFGGIPPRRGEVEVDASLNSNESCSSGSGIESQTRTRKPLMGKRILVVDDNPVGTKIATSVVSELGGFYVCCKNGAEACQLVCNMDSVHFDCILMDCEMPVMSGITATEKIREAERGVRMPIVALTAHSEGPEIDSMMKAGADGYITKPLNIDNFLKLVSRFIS